MLFRSYNLQTYRGRGDHEHSVIITANPLVKGSPGWTRPSFIEETRIHLTVSLLLKLQSPSLGIGNSHELIAAVSEALAQMKLASGDILDFDPAMEVVFIPAGDAQTERRMLRKLMPGYVLIERRDLMEKAMAHGTNSLEALLHFLEIRYQAETSNDSEIVKWKAKKEAKGWLVPIAVGFKGLSPIERVDRQRDAETPHRFAESLITLGEFKMPHHFANLADILWQYEYHPEQNFEAQVVHDRSDRVRADDRAWRCQLVCGAPRGGVVSSGGERTLLLACRGRLVKLAAA